MRAIAGTILVLAGIQALGMVGFEVLRVVLGLTGFALFIVGVCFLFIKDKP